MIDLTACPDTAASHWAGFTWQTFDALTHYKRVIVTLLAFAILPWIGKLPFKRWISALSLVTLSLYVTLASPLSTTVGLKALTLPISEAAPRHDADAIVVLGRGDELQPTRVDAATALWQQNRAPRIFVSGRGDAPKLIEQIAERGVPAAAIDGEPCSSTTEENAQYTASILRPQGVQRIILVTDGPHMLRSLLTFRSLGFDVTPYATQLPREKLGRNRSKFLIAREYMGIVSYGVLGRFFPREVAIDALPSPERGEQPMGPVRGAA
ncbi:MAG: YdcF family protein [Cyanobacteria bacterium P01_A01_bin.135]